MATITAGMTIQAAWFENIDSTGKFNNNINFLTDSTAITFDKGSSNLIQIDTSGNLAIRGDYDDNDTSI